MSTTALFMFDYHYRFQGLISGKRLLKLTTKQICVQLPTSAVNLAVPTFAAVWYDTRCYFNMRLKADMSHICAQCRYIHTHTHSFNGPLSGTTQVSRYQKGKTNLDFTGARDSEWQWHQLGHMQVCTSLQTDSHASTPPLSFFTGRMPFLPPNQQRQHLNI